MLAPEALSASVSFLWTLSRVVLSCRPRNLPLSVCPAVTSPVIFRTASSAFIPVWFFSNTMKHLDQEISNPLLLLFPIVRTHFVFEKSKNGVHAGWLCAAFVNTCEYLSLFPSFEECVLLADWLFSPFGKYCAYFSTQALPTVCFVSHIRSTALSKTDCRIRVFAGHTHTYSCV